MATCLSTNHRLRSSFALIWNQKYIVTPKNLKFNDLLCLRFQSISSKHGKFVFFNGKLFNVDLNQFFSIPSVFAVFNY